MKTKSDRLRHAGLAALVAVGVAACQGASSSPGLGAMLRVEGAQVVQGNIDQVSQDQATAQVSGIATASNVAFRGSVAHGVSGKVGPNAIAVAVGLPHDGVYWILSGGSRDSVATELLLFSSLLDFSPELGPDSPVVVMDDKGRPTLPVVFRAVTESGQLGPPLILSMLLSDSAPTGTLVFSLRWSGPVDLDLRVVAPLPDGSGSVEIWSKNGSNLPEENQSAYKNKGVTGQLDFDSNANCRIDNRNREDVVWTGIPPVGQYTVRVDAFSLCGTLSSEWEAQATWNGELITKDDGKPADVFGVATEAATARDHGAGAGTTAFKIDLQFQ